MANSFINFASSNEKVPVIIKKIGTFATGSLTYPEKAIDDKKEGIVYVSFELADNQTVTNILIEEGVSKELNQKAIEIVSHLKVEQNQFVSGKKYILPVRFVIK